MVVSSRRLGEKEHTDHSASGIRSALKDRLIATHVQVTGENSFSQLLIHEIDV
jgi:hypothetical protein